MVNSYQSKGKMNWFEIIISRIIQISIVQLARKWRSATCLHNFSTVSVIHGLISLAYIICTHVVCSQDPAVTTPSGRTDGRPTDTNQLTNQQKKSHLIQQFVWGFAIVEERRDWAELLAELVLANVEVGRLLPNVGHFVGLQWRHLLFGGDADLLGVVPLFGQFLNGEDRQKSFVRFSLLRLSRHLYYQ